MAHIDCYFGTISIWNYLAGNRLGEIAARHDAAVTYKPLDLNQLFARTGGKALADRHEARRAYRLQELARWSVHLGMPLNPQPAFFPVNGAPAAYVIIAAQAKGIDVGPLAHAIGRAVWAEERDIADDATLRAILAEQDLDPGLVDSGLFVGAETYARNLEDAVAAGAFGSPFYIIRETDQRFWGQDRLDFLDQALSRA